MGDREQMKTIHLYIAKRFIFWLGIVIVSVLFVVGIFDFIELLRRSIGRPHINSATVLEITLLRSPNYLQLFYPFIIMISSLITLWRLNHTQEIIAIRSLGLSAFQIILSMLASVALVSVVNLTIFNPLSAITQKRADSIYDSLFKRSGDSQLSVNDSGVWLRETKDNAARIIRVGSYNSDHFSNLNIYEIDNLGNLEESYMAKTAHLKEGHWELQDVIYWNKDKGESKLSHTSLDTELSLKKIFESNAKPETISFWNLGDFIQGLKKSGLSDRKYSLHWHAQLAKLGQAFAMILLSVVFCLHPTRYKKTATLILLGLVSGFVIHFLNDVVFALGLSQKLPIVLAAWAPVAITFSVSLAMLVHIEQSR